MMSLNAGTDLIEAEKFFVSFEFARDDERTATGTTKIQYRSDD